MLGGISPQRARGWVLCNSRSGGKCSLQLGSPSVGIFSIKFPEMLTSWAGGVDRE